jgi:hypothetical protein
MQLDLFLDGHETILVNDLVAALLAGRLEGARDALNRLRTENPAHPDLAPFDHLVRSLCEKPPAPPNPGEPGPVIERLTVLVPAANRLLGPGAPAFLLPWWQTLARTEAVPDQAEAAPLLRYWMGSARWHDGDEREAIRLWLPLCWLDPESFARQAPTLPSRIVREAWAAFHGEPDPGDGDDAHDGDVPWFPAWLALRHRWVAHAFRPDEVPDTGAPLQALRLLPGLLVLESQGFGDDLVRQRRALRDISPRFFQTYRRLVVEDRAMLRPAVTGHPDIAAQRRAHSW